MISLNHRYLQTDLDGEWHNEFVSTLRHEISHLRTEGHGADFLYVMNKLGGTRFASCSFRKLKSK